MFWTLSGTLLAFIFFPRVLSCSFIWDMLLCHLIFAASLCFYVLCRYAMSSSLGSVALSRCPMVPSGKVSHSPKLSAPRVSLVWLYVPSCCSLATTAKPSVGGTDPHAHWLWELAMTIEDELLYGGWAYEMRIGFLELWCILSLHFGCVVFEISWKVLWNEPWSICFLGPLRRGSSIVPGQLLPVLGPGHLLGTTVWCVVGSCLGWAWRHLQEAVL